MNFDPQYGLLAEFRDSTSLSRAARELKQMGYTKLEGFSPFPVEEIFEALPLQPNPIPWITAVGGVVGGVGGFLMQWYANSVSYPINIGSRPDFSWPAFIPVTFELTVLGAALSAALGMLALNGLPKISHSLFAMDRFSLSGGERYFLCVRSEDAKFRIPETLQALQSLGAIEILEVPHEGE
jgi:hypothetical protein